MRLTLAAAFLAQALPTLVVVASSSDPTVGGATRTSTHRSFPTKKSLPSDIKTIFKNASAVKEVQPLKNNHHIEESSRTSEHSSSSSETIDVDVGILGFGYQEYGLQDLSSTIELVKKRQRYYDDLLFPSPSACDPSSDYASKANCDCSEFDFDNRKGTFSCTSHTELCLEDDLCGSEVITNSIYEDGTARSDHCYHFDNGVDENSNSEVCYSQFLSISDHKESCGIFVNGEVCNSCQPQETDCHDFDCTNTDANIAGTNCEGGHDDVLFGLLLLQQKESIQKIVDPSTLFPSPSVCDRQNPAFDRYNCDCSNFDLDTMQGSFGCITEENFCLGDDNDFCGYNTITNTITEDGDVHTHFCYYIDDDDEPDSIDVCYSSYGDSDACSINVQGVECNSCQVVNGFINAEGNIEDRCTQFDCSNTIAGIEGMDCKGDHIFDAIIKKQGKGSTMSSTDSATEAPTQAKILKSRVLASGFLLKVEANSTSTSEPLSGPV
ncbi:unnamed protein product [Cylindrotheca closterium]|uniref:Subtilisin n=1 Tax=Cylindrotheca closterium TaxID=2856 RepID=A0AAD2FRI8_9STRA|nr:unnamed protein product [Cylindrotheca closterium]